MLYQIDGQLVMGQITVSRAILKTIPGTDTSRYLPVPQYRTIPIPDYRYRSNPTVGSGKHRKLAPGPGGAQPKTDLVHFD